MRNGPTALLTTTPEVTRILVRMDDDVVLKAALLPYWGPHLRAIPTLLEASLFILSSAIPEKQKVR